MRDEAKVAEHGTLILSSLRRDTKDKWVVHCEDSNEVAAFRKFFATHGAEFIGAGRVTFAVGESLFLLAVDGEVIKA